MLVLRETLSDLDIDEWTIFDAAATSALILVAGNSGCGKNIVAAAIAAAPDNDCETFYSPFVSRTSGVLSETGMKNIFLREIRNEKSVSDLGHLLFHGKRVVTSIDACVSLQSNSKSEDAILERLRMLSKGKNIDHLIELFLQRGVYLVSCFRPEMGRTVHVKHSTFNKNYRIDRLPMT